MPDTVILPAPQIIATLAVGQGPAGPAGPIGSQYQHTQAVASDVWTINHNLGFRPNITLTTTGGLEVWGELLHTGTNQAIATFDTPLAGLALCS